MVKIATIFLLLLLASTVQAASGSAGSSGSFTPSPFSGFLARPASGHIDLFAQIDLNDNGGLAAITRIEFDVAQVPEPASLTMLATGLGIVARMVRRTG